MTDSFDKRICAIVLHFRTERHTECCIDSLVDEGLRWILLIDNSADSGASVARMESLFHRWRDGGVVLQVVSRGINLGFAAAINWGVQLAADAGAEAVLLMNSDATFEPGAFLIMREALTKADIVVPACRGGDGKVSASLMHYDRITGVVSRRRFISGDTFFSGCCVLARTRVLTAFPYDEDFFFYGEDVELSHRLRKSGCRELLCQDAVVRHVGAGSAGNGSLFYEYHIARGHFLLATKLTGVFFLKFIFLMGRLVFLPSRALVRMLRQRSLIPISALLLVIYDMARNKNQSLTQKTTIQP